MIHKPKIRNMNLKKQTLAWTLCVPARLVAAPLSAVNPDDTYRTDTGSHSDWCGFAESDNGRSAVL